MTKSIGIIEDAHKIKEAFKSVNAKAQEKKSK